MAEYRFGDILRVDPAIPTVPQPDDRRWMYIGPMPLSLNHWTIFVGPSWMVGELISWPDHALLGFIVVEDDEPCADHNPNSGPGSDLCLTCGKYA